MPVKKYTRRQRLKAAGDQSFDETDKAPSHYRVTVLDIIGLVYAVIIHIVDVAFDINIACVYFKAGHLVYFALTLVFMFTPALLVTLLSLRMYVAEDDKTSVSRNYVRRKFICGLVWLLQMAPVMRYCDSLNYALRSRRAAREGNRVDQQKFYRLMLKEDSDVALLRVFECYLESAPQQILQITLLLLDSSTGSAFHVVQQCLSIASSFMSMAWCMASYHRAIRFDQEDKNNISWPGTIVQFLWHLNVTISRILSISVIAHISPGWTGLAVGAHWFVMTTWVGAIDTTAFCGSNQCFELFFAGSVGLVYIFNYVGVQEGPTRYHYLAYYPLSFLENLAAVGVWAYFANATSSNTWYYLPLIYVPLGTFLLGMISMVLYYSACHPNKGGDPIDALEGANCAMEVTDETEARLFATNDLSVHTVD